MFKVNWEKTSNTHLLPMGMVEKMVQMAYPNKILLKHELIAGGCGNLNVKIQLNDEASPLMLRIYLRDSKAACVEQKLGRLLKDSVPVPQTLFLSEIQPSQPLFINDKTIYTFAITEYRSGIALRDLLLSDASYDLSAVMHEVGLVLSKIGKYQFDTSGFFDESLNVLPRSYGDDYILFVKECLSNKTVISTLSTDERLKIEQVLVLYGHLFPDDRQKQLVHADYDPANILVKQVDGDWHLSAVLDWEFAFSGSFLHDVANMLRYAHKMPATFQQAFLSGLNLGGVVLPPDWQVSVHLLNMLSLLDCLKRADGVQQPNQCADIKALIGQILATLQMGKG